MNNISLNEIPIELKVGSNYIVIDALYLRDVKNNISSIIGDDVIKNIRVKVFPYTDTPFAEFVPNESIFNLNRIKKVIYEEVDLESKRLFSTDTGVLVFVEKVIILDFAEKFDFGQLVTANVGSIDIAYWNSIAKLFDKYDVALVASCGNLSKLEFDGSGTYEIV